jgi:hypothetical protein
VHPEPPTGLYFNSACSSYMTDTISRQCLYNRTFQNNYLRLSWKSPIMFPYVRSYSTPNSSWTRHSEPRRTDLRKYRSFVIPYVTKFVTPSIIGIRGYGCDIYSQVEFLYLHRNFHLPTISIVYMVRCTMDCVNGDFVYVVRSTGHCVNGDFVYVVRSTGHCVNGDFRLRGPFYQALRKRRFSSTWSVLPDTA